MNLLELFWNSKTDDDSKLKIFFFLFVVVFCIICMCKDKIDDWSKKNPKKTDAMINNM